MSFEKVEFEFPDESEAKKKDKEVEPTDNELDIEIVDDTPPKDRNRKPLDTAPEEVTEEELESYSEKIRKRIQHFSKGYHDERRAKESALREKEEALKLAQSIIEENNKLKNTVNQNQQTLLEQAKRVVDQELNEAKQKVKQAYESGDSDAMVAAQEELAAVKYKAERVANFKPTPLQETQNPVLIPPVQIDNRAATWQDNNKWFGKDEEMTNFALAVHSKLVKQGVDPKSDEYYEKIDARMRQVFPEEFGEQESDEDEKPRRKATVVAPATRSTAPKKIVLTATQVAIAKKLGVPLELYARKVAEEMRK